MNGCKQNNTNAYVVVSDKKGNNGQHLAIKKRGKNDKKSTNQNRKIWHDK